VGVTILPPITSALLVGFFGTYLSLGKLLLGDDERDAIDDDEENDGEEEEENWLILPLASFSSALASAALLSPQGLIAGVGNESYLPFTSPVALLAVGVSLLTIIAEINKMGQEEKRMLEKEERIRVVKEERRRMDRWDEELEDL